MTRCLPLLLAVCLTAAGQSAEDQNSGGKKATDVRSGSLLVLVQQQATMMSMINRLHDDLNRVQDDLATYKNQVQDDLATYNNQVVSYNNQVASYKTETGEQFRKVDDQLQAMQHEADAFSKSVAFTVRISDDNGGHGMALGYRRTVVFDDVVTNIGSAYNANNGIFTAPLNGTYVFFLSQMSDNHNQHLILDIVKNGATLDWVFAEGKADPYDQGSSQVSTHLNAGEHVWVRLHSGNAVRASFWTIFTGFLLHAD